jgi:hypothetical protein
VETLGIYAGIPAEFLGVPLQGKWWLVIFYLIVLCFNIFGEEFWWRGYLLPRQERTHGKWTWLVHGILWNLFHVFWKWNLIALIPQTLSLAYVAFKRKNTTPGIIVHWFNNGLGLGIIGGGTGGLLGAIVWAAVTYYTEYQIGWMAVGVGFLVGYGVSKLGKGFDRVFGVAGGLIALVSVTLGNFLASIGFLPRLSRWVTFTCC